MPSRNHGITFTSTRTEGHGYVRVCFGVPQHYAGRLQLQHTPQSFATIFYLTLDIEFISGASVHPRPNDIVPGSMLTFLKATHALHFAADCQATEPDLT